jgi:hypothetical protein
MIASTILLASEKGRPLRPVGRGNSSAINDHCSSDSIWKRDIPKRCQTEPQLFVRHALAGAPTPPRDNWATRFRDRHLGYGLA